MDDQGFGVTEHMRHVQPGKEVAWEDTLEVYEIWEKVVVY